MASNPQSLQYITIEDFTPGIVRFARGQVPNTFSYIAPLGSASHAYRCYAEPRLGLCPFPTYSLFQTISPGHGGTATLASMRAIGQVQSFTGLVNVRGVKDSMVYSVTSKLATINTPNVYFDVFRDTLSVYTNSITIPLANSGWNDNCPNIDLGLYSFAGPTFVRSAITQDPLIQPPKWVATPSPNSVANSNNGAITGVPATSWAGPTMYHGFRTLFVPTALQTSTPGTIVDESQFYDTDIQAVTNITGPNFFFPEMGNAIGTWGSMDAGELFFAFQSGGGVLVYGDPLFPSSATKLPGVVGTGQTMGPAAMSPVGLVYAADLGVYIWSGGIGSQKVSESVPDAVFSRTDLISNQATPGNAISCTTHPGAWNDWVLFPNNWTWDSRVGGWWLCEDPLVNNFQVHTKSATSNTFFYSSVATVPGSANVLIQGWNFFNAASSYRWISNPLADKTGNVGNRSVIKWVEIVASNPTNQIATVKITPTAPFGQTAFPQQNPNQLATFTIPATTSNYRASQPLGYSDYNPCIQIDASTPTAAAPIIHAVTVGFLPEESEITP